MTDSDLTDMLKSARLPERPSDYWHDFPREVTRHLKVARPRSEYPRFAHYRTAAWAFAAAACLVIGILIALQLREGVGQQMSVADARKMFLEVSAVFPDQVEAIINDGVRLELVLSNEPDVSRGVPVLLRVCKDRKCHRIITRSGQKVPVDGQFCDVLVDGRGNVLIIGETLVWSSSRKSKTDVAGLRIDAQLLEQVL